MIFNKLILNNIGPYEGVNSFSFTVNEEKNTILLGGKNGSGKTTFLNSVRLALYGPLAYGIKSQSKEYLSKVSALLNSKAMHSPSRNSFSIQIEFNTVENLQKVNISIIRSWTISETSVKESVDIIKDGVHLNEVQKDEFYETLRTNFPPSLLELCFFDGEDISQLSNEDKLSTYLKELSTKLFNLDIFQNLEKDLNNYISQSSKTNKETKLEKEKEQIEEELNTKITHLRELTNSINNNREELSYAKEQYTSIKRDFSLHGGLIQDERNQIQNDISSLEANRKLLNEKIKEFIANDLPFFIALPRLIELVEQLKNEENFHISNVIREKISSLSVQDIIQELGVEKGVRKEQKLKQILIDDLTTTKDIDTIHNASNTEANQVYTLLSETNIDKLQEFNQLIVDNKTDLNKLRKLRQKLKDNESSSEFNEMINSMEQYNKKIADYEQVIESLQTQEKPLNEEIIIINKKYENIKSELYNIYKTKSSYKESEKLLNISKKFQDNQLRKKITDVEYFSSKMIKELSRKELFINHIKIDYKTFQITILDYDNVKINKDILSAGEKELLVLSIIWGIVSSSKKQLPFVLDTLLGRLDIEHKQSIITKLIPNFSKQIIVLSTDSEISNHLYSQLAPFVSNEYTLNYDNRNKKTNIETHFFNYNSVKVGN